ncbi:MAG: hypothetical protein IPJ94_26535 [Chloroflexi bacterium]|nr:hypothetical protein [Chloroflexota bacterium]
MNNPFPDPSTSTRVRIASHVTQSRFLHVEDSLQLGKVRLYGGNYRRSAGASALTAHFLDVADARVLFDALARGEEGFAYKEYKGTPGKNGQPPVSRVLSVAVKGENVYVELKSGPGKLTPTGAVTPAGPAQVEVNVAFKRHEARRLAATVLAYLHAWDVVRMMAQRPVVGKVRPYELVPAEGVRSAERGVRNGRILPLRTLHSPLHTPPEAVSGVWRRAAGEGRRMSPKYRPSSVLWPKGRVRRRRGRRYWTIIGRRRCEGVNGSLGDIDKD